MKSVKLNQTCSLIGLDLTLKVIEINKKLILALGLNWN